MRFNASLLILMALAGLGALAMPPGLGDSLRRAGVLLMPVSLPVRMMAGTVDSRLAAPQASLSPETSAGRTVGQLRNDYETIKYQNTVLLSENELLRRQLADVRAMNTKMPVKFFHVIGGDLGKRQVLTLLLSTSDGVAPNLPVMYPPKNLAGKLEILGMGSASVRLITDRDSRVTGVFGRHLKDVGFTQLPQAPKTLEGSGAGRMLIKSVKREEADSTRQPEFKLAVGDWFVVADSDLPAEVQGYKLGEIESITEGKKPLFVDIVLRPDTDLMKLKEVMVPVKK
jgi:cell shape-determining protein MreC